MLLFNMYWVQIVTIVFGSSHGSILILDSTDYRQKNHNQESAAECRFQLLGGEMTIASSVFA